MCLFMMMTKNDLCKKTYNHQILKKIQEIKIDLYLYYKHFNILLY